MALKYRFYLLDLIFSVVRQKSHIYNSSFRYRWNQIYVYYLIISNTDFLKYGELTYSILKSKKSLFQEIRDYDQSKKQDIDGLRKVGIQTYHSQYDPTNLLFDSTYDMLRTSARIRPQDEDQSTITDDFSMSKKPSSNKSLVKSSKRAFSVKNGILNFFSYPILSANFPANFSANSYFPANSFLNFFRTFAV